MSNRSFQPTKRHYFNTIALGFVLSLVAASAQDYGKAPESLDYPQTLEASSTKPSIAKTFAIAEASSARKHSNEALTQQASDPKPTVKATKSGKSKKSGKGVKSASNSTHAIRGVVSRR